MKLPFFSLSVLIVLAAVQAGTVPVIDHDLDIPVGQYRYVSIPVQQAQEQEARLEGELEVAPDSLQVELLLIWEYQLPAWTGLQPGIDTLHYARMGTGRVEIPLQGFGRYALIVSNRGNYAPASVHARLSLLFRGEGRVYDPLQTALYIALALMAVAGIVALVVVAVRLVKNK